MLVVILVPYLRTLLIEAASIFDADAAIVFIVEDALFVPKVILPEGDLSERSFRLGDGLLGESAALSVPTVITPDRYASILEDAKSAMVIPIVTHEARVGVILLESKEINFF